jgi:hypothetical protein
MGSVVGSRRFPVPGRQSSWVREGACAGHPRGLRAGHGCRGGTRARGRAAGLRVADPEWGTGGPQALACPGASSRLRARLGDHARGQQTRDGDASDKRSARRRGGGSRRGASYRRREGREAQATSGREGAVAQRIRWPATGERRCAHQPCPRPASGRESKGSLAWAAAALREEPDACMAHVRVCGGAGWVTTGSTRQPTPYSVRSCLASAIGRGSPRALI